MNVGLICFQVKGMQSNHNDQRGGGGEVRRSSFEIHDILLTEVRVQDRSPLNCLTVYS